MFTEQPGVPGTVLCAGETLATRELTVKWRDKEVESYIDGAGTSLSLPTALDIC